MCIAIYLALIGLLLFYADYAIDQYSLAVSTGEQEVVVVAVGWEMVGLLWPVFAVAMLLASAVSVWIVRRCRSCSPGTDVKR